MTNERTAWGWGLASIDAAGNTLDVWYPQLTLGANAGIGISLGDNCVVEAGLYVTAGTKITVWDKAKAAAGEPLDVVKGADLSGKDNILFIRNSVNGRIEARYRKTGIELNAKLHKN